MAIDTNTRGILASVCPDDIAEIQLFVVPDNAEIDALLRICNIDDSERQFKVAHCPAGHGDVDADAKDWLFYNKRVPANETYEISIHAKAGETIRVASSLADVLTFHLSGNKKVVS